MPSDNSLLFIDSNKYLDLYRMKEDGKKLLPLLGELVDYIFVTKQVVSEVERNKIQVTAGFLQQQCKELKIQTFGLPDYLSSTCTDQRKGILQEMSDVTKKIQELNNKVDDWGTNIMEQISSSQDEVSKALSPIFAKAVSHSPEELQKAKERRELGNPPGKGSDPIGDQLNWEQILTRFRGKERLWIISNDSDYGLTYNRKGFLNSFLYKELCTPTSTPDVYLFEKLINGLQDFVHKTGVKAEQSLTSEEAKDIEIAEESLPPLIQSNQTWDLLADLQKINQRDRAFNWVNLDPQLNRNRSLSGVENIQRQIQYLNSQDKRFRF